MARLSLPKIPISIKQMKYRPSGLWERGRLLTIFIKGLGYACLVGIVGQFLGLGIPLILIKLMVWLGNDVCGLFGWGLIRGVLLMGLYGIALFGFPIIFGSAIGGYTRNLIVKNNLRSLPLSLTLGFLGSLTGYGVFFVLRFAILKSIDSSYSFMVLSAPFVQNLLATPSNTSLENDIIGRVILCAFVLVDFLLIFGFAIFKPYNQVRGTPFCERCKKWYTELMEEGDIELGALPRLLEAIETGSDDILRSLPRAKGLPRATLLFAKCRTCQQADVQFAITITWQAEARANSSISLRTKRWLCIMIPAKLGRHIRDSMNVIVKEQVLYEPAG